MEVDFQYFLKTKADILMGREECPVCNSKADHYVSLDQQEVIHEELRCSECEAVISRSQHNLH